MLKRYSIITLLFVAYTIVLGHSIIPHHHHDDDHEMEQSSHHHHDQEDDHHNNQENDHNDNSNSGLAHDFENYMHSGNTGDIHQQPDIKISHNAITTVYLVALFDFKIKAAESPPPKVWLSNNHIPPLPYSLSSKGLRAPPCFLA
jgi:hypothetical protein